MTEDDYRQHGPDEHGADRGFEDQGSDSPPVPPPASPQPPTNPAGPVFESPYESNQPPPASWPAPSETSSFESAGHQPSAAAPQPPAIPAFPPPAGDPQPTYEPLPPSGYPQAPAQPGQPHLGYGQTPAGPPPGGPGGPGLPPSPGGSSSSGRGLGIAIAAIVGVVVLAGLGFAIATFIGRVEDVREAQPDLNEATLEQIEEVASDAELERSDAECIEDRMDGLSTTLNDVFTDVSGDAREAMVQAMLDCFPDPANSDLLVGSFSANMELGMGGTIEVDNEEGSCMVQYILDNSPNPARTLSEADGAQDVQLLLETFELCLDPEDLAIVMGEAGSGPQAYGDDERLDGLYDDCAAGDGRACDVLYLQSSVDSAYETFALDCGGLVVQESGWCTPGVAFDASDQVPEDDPGLLEQVAECEQGDMTACDFVFMVSPFGSDIGRIGFTCGGAIPVGALPDCRTRMGE